jgi:solute carrier family 13 (sodium-dependent dicarboxylate transporter), member 2/3/5
VNTNTKHWINIGVGILLFFLFISNPFGWAPLTAKTLAVGTLMIFWWVSEALPMPAVALLPLVLFPLLGIAKMDETSAPYANPVVFLFMGGFFIGLAIEKWNLHKRIALNIVRVTGTSGNKIILGFILATALLSMWLSNTATTMMMFPIATSVITVMDQKNQTGNLKNFALCMMLAIAYASNIGGIATIIGTPPNVAFVSFMDKQYGHPMISFAQWMLVCTPIALLLLFCLYIVMVKFLYPNHIASNEQTKMLIHDEIKKLGPMSKAEKRVLIVFVTTALLWIFKEPINTLKLVKLDDNMIAVFGALLLFIIPNGHKEEESHTLLIWSDTKKMAWGILLLFGGGICLANALDKAGLIASIGAWVGAHAGNGIGLVFLIALLSTFISEVMSNIAQVIVFAPVVAGIANAVGINPLIPGMAMALGASLAGMLPMGTPPNAIVFASGHIKMKEMMKTGFVMNLIAVFLVTLICWYFLPFVVGKVGM